MGEKRGFSEGTFSQGFFQEKKGFLLVLLTALVSGVSIFANSFAVKGFDPAAFTFLKNAAVAVFLFSIILLFKELPSLKSLSRNQLGKLAAIGLIGGSIPFLLYFYALKMTTAINAGFLHKTLFIWATVFAILFLKEKVDRKFLAAAVLLLAGNFLIFNISIFGLPELLVLAATMLWAAENTLSKHVLKELSGSTVAFGRMFFGSAFILAFLLITGNTAPVFEMSIAQWQWIALTSVLLLGYVFTFYNGLKHLPVHKATAVLLLAQPITAFLSFAFLGKEISLQQAFGFLLILSGVFLLTGVGFFLNKLKSGGPAIAPRRS